MTNAIEIKNFSKAYNGTNAVTDLTMTVREGELFGLIGPDGAGKTTMMRTLCTLLTCEQGEMQVDGKDVRKDIAAIRSILGYMPQRFSLYPDLTVEQNLNFFAELFGVSKLEKAERMAELYQFSKLEPFKKRLAGDLSGGMKQKLALSCTLIHTPKILILDEPTTGVDPVSRREFWEILRRLQGEGVTILVSTPYMDEAGLCARVAFMHQGRILAMDKPENLHELFPDHLYDMTSSDNRALESFFRRETDARSQQIFGERLHASFENELLRAQIDEIVQNAPVQIEDFHRIQPSIEDTFLALMKKQERAV